MPATTITPKPGDTVHVEFDGVVSEICWDERVLVIVDGEDRAAWCHRQACTVVNPARPGDVATLAVLDELPHGSIVTADDGTIAYLDVHGHYNGGRRAWRLPGDERLFTSSTLANRRGLTVLRVGTGS